MTGKTLEERFWAKVDNRNGEGCWTWNGDSYPKGYGRLKIDGKGKRAHRISYELFCGPIPDGLHVLHKCDNPACVRPDHLWVGTNKDNIRDKVKKGRQAHNRGVNHGRAKLTPKQVMKIRQDRRTCAAIAADYQISETHAWQIKARKCWAHLDA